jgi:hypothetical protein
MNDKDRQLLYETYRSLLNEEMHDCLKDGLSYDECCAQYPEECEEDQMEESTTETLEEDPFAGRKHSGRKHSQALKAAEYEKLVHQGRDVPHTGWTGEGYDELVADIMNGKMDKAAMEQLTVDELVKIILIIRGNK